MSYYDEYEERLKEVIKKKTLMTREEKTRMAWLVAVFQEIWERGVKGKDYKALKKEFGLPEYLLREADEWIENFAPKHPLIKKEVMKLVKLNRARWKQFGYPRSKIKSKIPELRKMKREWS